MANPAKDMVLFPSGGMSAEDIGDSQKQNPALVAVQNYDNANSDGQQKGPEGDGGVSMFGNGPRVIQNMGGGEKVDCCPAKPGCEPTGGAKERY